MRKDAINLYGWSSSKDTPYADYGSTNTTEIEDVLKAPDESHIAYAADVIFKNHNKVKSKTKFFPFCAYSKKVGENFFIDFMNNFKPENSKPKRNLICDWSDKSENFAHYRNLIFFLGHSMGNIETNTVVSFKQRPFLANYIDIKAKDRARAKTKKIWQRVPKKLICSFYGKTIENPRKRKLTKNAKEPKDCLEKQTKMIYNDVTQDCWGEEIFCMI